MSSALDAPKVLSRGLKTLASESVSQAFISCPLKGVSVGVGSELAAKKEANGSSELWKKSDDEDELALDVDCEG